jgi:hypothetical protein
MLQHPCPFGLPATVQTVELRGDIALVEVVTEHEPVRLARFYRQTDLGWRHTAPQATFWGQELVLDYGQAIVRCYERDLPYVEPLVQEILRTLDQVSPMLGTPSNGTLEVSFIPDDGPPGLFSGRIVLPSPWLSGIPVDGAWSEAYLDELTSWVTYQVAFQLIYADAERGLGQIREALLEGDAASQAQKGTTLASGIESDARHDDDPLPQVLRTLQSVQSVYAMVLLLAESPLAPSALDMGRLEALMAVEREASRVGQEAISLLLDEYDHW